MEHKDTKNNLFLLTIVGIVAIVAIVILVASSGSRTYTSSEDSTGQAARATASADIATEGKTSTTTTTVKSYCIDSDGGKNYFIRGIVRYSDGRTNGSATDYCRSYNTSTLVEYYCSSGRLSQLNYACPYGCLNGACKNQTITFKPDLIVEDILLMGQYNNTVPNNMSVNTTFKIYPKIKNMGNAISTSGFYNNFSLWNSYGQLVGQAVIRCSYMGEQIPSGQSFICIPSHDFNLNPGNYTVIMVTDDTHLVNESNENNNVRTESLYVYSGKEDGR